MSTDDDDKSTLILDFNALKAELDKDDDSLGIKTNELEFEISSTDEEDIQVENSGLTGPEMSKDDSTDKPEVHFYQYQSDYFQKRLLELEAVFTPHIHSDLKDINKILAKDKKTVLVFYYNEAPKIVNQLTMQMKLKFPHARAVIIAKNLSKEKALEHAKSKYGANAYLRDPFSSEQLLKKVKKLLGI